MVFADLFFGGAEVGEGSVREKSASSLPIFPTN
jgi:hypothetical protein